jgi:broad specificity phosphatase PhoE
MRWLLVPHAETDANARGVFQGSRNDGLNERGCRQAAALARRLRTEPITAAHVSDLLRARQTLEILVQNRDFPVYVDARLRERSFGDWEGRSREEVERMHPEGLPEFPPGGESFTVLARRVGEWWRAMEERGYGEEDTLLLVAHRGTLRVLLCLLLGLPPERHWQFFLHQASLSEIFAGPGGCVLTRLNDTHHLEGV